MDPSYFSVLVLACLFQHASTDIYKYYIDDCDEHPQPRFGYMWCSKLTDYRLKCEVKCDNGYELGNGDDGGDFFCDGLKGGWINRLPPTECHKKCDPPCKNNVIPMRIPSQILTNSVPVGSDYINDCRELPQPEFGSVWCSKLKYFRRKCEIKCDYGYELDNGKDRDVFECDANHGGWKGHPPPTSCLKKCDPPCTKNAKPVDMPIQLLKHNAQISSDYINDCRELPQPEFGYVWCSKLKYFRRKCEIKCDYGYELDNGKDTDVFECDANHGGWKGHPPPTSCLKKCDPPCTKNDKPIQLLTNSAQLTK